MTRSKAFVASQAPREGLDAGLAAVGGRHDVAILAQDVLQRAAAASDRRRPAVCAAGGRAAPVSTNCPVSAGSRGGHEHQPHGGALAGRAVDLQVRAVPLHHAVNHGEAEAGAAFALGGEERFEAAAAGFLVHADAGVAHFRDDRGHAGLAQPACAVRSVSVPPAGMASTALNTRLVSASRISLSAPMMRGRSVASSVRSSMAMPPCCGWLLQRGRVRSTTCSTALLRSTCCSVSWVSRSR